ncbi:MAG: hypothetical protein OXI96_01715 [Acidimicrobiaceae bacterium]|nr:hypothetical protein [Acidimicrobiaceae bacterium]
MLPYNWTQLVDTEDDNSSNRMSREALIYVCGLPEDIWDDPFESNEDFREYLDAKTENAVAEIEEQIGRALKFREADMGRGASWVGAAIEIVEAIAVAGGASAAVFQAASFVKWTYHKIASATGYRPLISLGAAEYLAIADLIDRVDTTPGLIGLIGSGDMRSNSGDQAFTGGDAFFVVLRSEKKLHHYHVSAYGEVYYIGTSPFIPDHWDESPPYWADGDTGIES